MRFIIATFSFVCLLLACRNDKIAPALPEPLLAIPEGFPEPEFPADNAFTEARWALGKRLFYSTALSRDSSLSCASCHLSQYAFSDTVRFSPGVDAAPGTRNSPSLANVAYHPYFTREGGVPTLEMQILVPIQEHNEFDFNIILIGERLQADATYQRMKLEAYEEEKPDHFVITRALATFERSLLSGGSPYDAFTNGATNALTAAEQRGMDLFFSSKTNCSECHGGFNFTNYAFENNGLYAEYPDEGRFRLTGNEEDRARFKVPSLRNIELTAPYMHDGSFADLASVVAHYNTGGAMHPQKSEKIHPLGLSAAEQGDLVAFLAALTDQDFVENPKFK